MVNSITEQRWDIMNLYKDFGPFKVIVMASERMEDGIAKQNKTADEIASTAKRAALRLQNDYGMALDDIYIDISVSAVVADTNGLHRATLDAIRTLHDDPRLKGLHIMGGLTNIGQQLPPKAADDSDLKAFARMRVSDFGGAARLRYDPVYAMAKLSSACRMTITFLLLTRIFSNRPAVTRYAPSASFIDGNAVAITYTCSITCHYRS